jgi:glycosyltransferase involved in cell wall biosynthesis
MAKKLENNKVLIIENFASDFFKARLPLARYLKELGWDVYALVPGDSEYSKRIAQERIKVIEYNFDRNNKGIFQIISLIKVYRRILYENNFSITHSFRFQPNLLNILSGIGLRHKKILHVTGLGIAFSNKSLKFLILKWLSQIIFLLKFLFADKIIVQNEDDINDIWAGKLFRNKLFLIGGSGVDIDQFSPSNFDKIEIRNRIGIRNEQLVFICVTRLIWEKGIKELVDAFYKIQVFEPNIILYIVGWPDYDNPRHVTDEYINSIEDGTCIHFLGKRDDISQLLAASDVFIFPSYYREGVPRSLLEALSMGLPIITTDMPGCKDTVHDNINGILITPMSVDSIINAIKLIMSKNKKEMGDVSRTLAVEKFQDKLIFKQIESLYN